jgi:hypothetical protein
MIAMRHEEHPAAKIFPMLDSESFDRLKDDIRQHGQRDLVVLFEGLVLDGRNRYKACCELGIEPDVCELEECDDPVAYVISTNLHRRHLTKAQWTAIAVEYIPMLAEQAAKRKEEGGKEGGRGRKKTLVQDCTKVSANDGKATTEAAKLTGTSHGYVAAAKKIKDESPEVFEELKAGKLTVPQAVRKSKGEPEPTGERKKSPKAKASPVEPNEIGFLKHSFDEFAADLLEGKPAHHQIAFWQHAFDEAGKRGAK